MARNTPSNVRPSDVDHAHEARQSAHVKTFLGILLPLTDATALVLAFMMAYVARQWLPLFAQPSEQPALLDYAGLLLLQTVLILVLFYFNRLYHLRRVYDRFNLFRSILAIITLGVLLANGIQELLFRDTVFNVAYPRSLIFYVVLFGVLFVGLARELHRLLQTYLRKRGIANDNLLLVGTGKLTRDLLQRINAAPELGYRIIGIVNPPDEHQGRVLGVPVLGNYPELPELLERYAVRQVIIAVADAKRSELVDLVTLCQRDQVDIKIYPDIFAVIAGDMNVDALNGTPLLTVRDIALRGWKLSLKRSLDFFGSAAGLVLLSPLFLLTAYLIRRESPGPVFYTQERMGLDGKPFPMIKFRSMRLDAEASGPGWTKENDPRVTRIGRWIRKTNWDEIPQLINVLLGHMSLVGPRPERPVYVQEFRQHIPRYMERHREKAGMTGWAQIHGLRGDTSIAERTTYDLWYVENWSLWLDIRIIFWTIWQTVTGRSKNAY